MVVIIFRGNFTITQDVTVRPEYNTIYGSSKGFFIFVKGDFVNKGTIDQNHSSYFWTRYLFMA